MQGKYALTFLTLVLVLTTTNFISSNDGSASLLHLGTVYAQSPPDLGTGDNSTDLGAPGDNSTDLGGPSGNPGDLGSLGDNPTDLGLTPGGNLTGNMPSVQNSTGSATTPEFGSIALAVLVLSILSIIIISARTRLRFSRF
jgi:predicted secreted protein with PEFG-CTERM motif